MKGYRVGVVKRSPSWAGSLRGVALGFGLVGVYVWLSLAAALAAPGLAGPLTLVQPVAALVLGRGLYTLGARWARMGAMAMLLLALARPAAGLLGLGAWYQLLGDALLLATAGLVLHRLSRMEGLHPRAAETLDRMGGVVVLSSFALLLQMPLVAALALAVSGAVLLQGYTVLSALAASGRRR